MGHLAGVLGGSGWPSAEPTVAIIWDLVGDTPATMAGWLLLLLGWKLRFAKLMSEPAGILR